MNRKTAVSLVIALLVCTVILSGYGMGWFERAELFLYDVQAKTFRADKAPNDKVKVLLVDEATLKSMDPIAGRWPWPRAIWADLLEFLSAGGAKAVMFDILFLEHDRANSANDKALINATRASGSAIHSLMIFHENEDPDAGNEGYLNRPLPAPFIKRFAIQDVSGTLPQRPETSNNDFALPIAGLAEAAKGMAVVEFSPDMDNGNRRTKPLREYQGAYFPVLGLSPFVDKSSTVKIEPGRITINDRHIPVDAQGNVIINMYGLDKLNTYSMGGIFSSLQKIRKGEVENLMVDPSEFKDSIVFVGTSAIGTADLKAIPMSANAPGVYLHAFLASNYLQQDFMAPPSRLLTQLSVLIAVGLTLWAVMYSLQLSTRLLVPLGMLIVYLAGAFISFKSNLQIELVPFILSTLSTGFLAFGYLTLTEGAERRRVSQLFSQYVSKDVLDDVLHNYKEYLKSSAGQKVEVTVLFSDIRSFTTMSETTPPEKIVEMLNVHFTVMADIILKHNGTIDKYIGDAIMAFWGAPVRTGDHADEAVRAGQEMLEGLAEVNRILKERGFEHEVHIGVGINTGVVTIGNIGSDKKKNYTVVGDAVNLASRLESLTKEKGAPLLFSEYTYNKLSNKTDCELIGNVTVKGREQSVDIYTIR